MIIILQSRNLWVFYFIKATKKKPLDDSVTKSTDEEDLNHYVRRNDINLNTDIYKIETVH